MKKSFALGMIMLMFPLGLFAENGFNDRPILNNVSMPTGFTLNRGEFTVGLGTIGFGITDRIQLETNILLYLLQVYNGDIKFNFFRNESVSGGDLKANPFLKSHKGRPTIIPCVGRLPSIFF